jgi:gliding motility-associated-like protein
MRIKGVLAFIKKYNLFFILIGLLAGIPGASYAQLCSGSLGDPVVKIDFGQGTATHAGALPAGTTSYLYTAADFPPDGSYTVENTTAGSGNVWWSTTDHTGNIGGYMMVVNASVSKTDYFYKSTVTGLCPGTTFEFAAWITNLLRTNDISPPDITFTIITTGGTVLATYNTGTIPLTPSGNVWKQYGTYFTTPAGVSDVVIQVTNNSAGGAPANDLALDDITLRPCGPVVSSSFISGNSSSLTQNACAGTNQSYTLSSTVSAGGYTNPVYQWQVNTGSAWTNIAGATTTTYGVNFQPAVTGVYKYRLLTSEAANSGTVSCQVASNELTLTVADSPIAAFVLATNNNNCLVSTVDFKDASTSRLKLTGRLWDFGDGQTSTSPRPTHTYTTPGDFNVRLTVTNSAGCSSTSAVQTMHIVPKLVADFTASASICPDSIVTFTDKSINVDPIAQWQWNFGDGTTVTRTTGATFTHTYATTGTYKVTLEVISDKGCVSDLRTQTINLISVNFNVCPNDITQFTDITALPGNTGLTYNWNFGDAPAATVSNPNTSNVQNPTHKYTNPGTYTATLKVFSQNGCAPVAKSKSFIISSTPVAKFDIENKNTLCGGDSVTFVDQSLSANAAITKLIWYYDIDNHPTDTIVFKKTTIRTDKKYRHFYGLNNTALPQIYHAVLVVYTVSGCSYTTTRQNVIINPTPAVTLMVNNNTLVSPVIVCQDGGAVTITAQSNVPGSGTFSGTGISSQGVFDPKISGAGTFTLSCVFVADNNGCTTTTPFVITVSPPPVITLQATANVLEGEQNTLNPKVAGDSLKYLWSPITGISNPNILNPSFSPTVDTKYTLTVTSAKGCSASAQVDVHVLKKPVIPNAFTPNNDGINDTWDIKYLNIYTNATIEVFNRLGVKVYSSKGYTIPWDGKFDGKSLPFGVYYYIIDPKTGAKKITGSLTIIR